MPRRVPQDRNDAPLPPPAPTLEGREDQLTAMVYDLVEQRVRDGTASAQETVHFLRAGSREKQMQLDKLRGENEVLKTRVKEMEQRSSGEELMARALEAFKGYSGQIAVDPEETYYDEDIY